MTDTPNRMQSLHEFLEDDGLFVPGVKSRAFPNGKDYIIPSPDIETGLRLTAFAEFSGKIAAAQKRRDETGENVDPGVTSADVERLMGKSDTDFQTLVLGADVYAEMQADGVPWRVLQRIVELAFATFTFGDEQAEKMVRDRVAAGKVTAPTNRAARRGGSKTTGSTRKAPRASGGSSR